LCLVVFPQALLGLDEFESRILLPRYFWGVSQGLDGGEMISSGDVVGVENPVFEYDSLDADDMMFVDDFSSLFNEFSGIVRIYLSVVSRGMLIDETYRDGCLKKARSIVDEIFGLSGGKMFSSGEMREGVEKFFADFLECLEKFNSSVGEGSLDKKLFLHLSSFVSLF
jgi:hypothetical protein